MNFSCYAPSFKSAKRRKSADTFARFGAWECCRQKIYRQLFTDYLGEIGAKHLSDNLSISKPKLFIRICRNLGILKYSKSIKALEAGIYSNHPDLVLPAVKAVSLLYDDTDNESVSILAKFYLTFKDEVKLSKAIKYLYPLQKHLIPIFTESYNSADEDRKMWLLKFWPKQTVRSWQHFSALN
jgi:hypothetical protein